MKVFSKLLTCVLIVSMIGLFANTVYSQEDLQTLSGIVLAVDVENDFITVQKEKTETALNFIINEKTVIKKGDKTITLADINVKDSVEIKFTKSSEVESIIVR